jgi:hypothetical protein
MILVAARTWKLQIHRTLYIQDWIPEIVPECKWCRTNSCCASSPTDQFVTRKCRKKCWRQHFFPLSNCCQTSSLAKSMNCRGWSDKTGTLFIFGFSNEKTFLPPANLCSIWWPPVSIIITEGGRIRLGHFSFLVILMTKRFFHRPTYVLYEDHQSLSSLLSGVTYMSSSFERVR